MPQGPAARITDPVVHPLPPVLTGGPVSPNVIIGMLPAWLGLPSVGGAAVAASVQAAKQVSDTAIKVAEAATLAAAGTPGAPAAKAAEEVAKATAAATMGSMISSMSGGASLHACTTPLPIPPHGPGVVVDGSPTVSINNMMATRQGDTIVEAVGPPNKIAMGCMTVHIGNSGGGGSAQGYSTTVTVTPPSKFFSGSASKSVSMGSNSPTPPPTFRESTPIQHSSNSPSPTPSSPGATPGMTPQSKALIEAADSGKALVQVCPLKKKS